MAEEVRLKITFLYKFWIFFREIFVFFWNFVEDYVEESVDTIDVSLLF